MGLNSLKDIQYNNMFKMVNSFLYEYRCDMEMRIHIRDKVVYERDSENRKKRKKIKTEHERLECLMIHGNASEYICSVVKNKDGKFEIYKDGYAWNKEPKIFFIAQNSEEVGEKVEEICRQHYFEKYGTWREPYSSGNPKRKRLSVGEICDWYNQFRKLDMSIDDIRHALSGCEKIKKENEEYKKLLLGAAKKKGLVQ